MLSGRYDVTLPEHLRRRSEVPGCMAKTIDGDGCMRACHIAVSYPSRAPVLEHPFFMNN